MGDLPRLGSLAASVAMGLCFASVLIHPAAATTAADVPSSGRPYLERQFGLARSLTRDGHQAAAVQAVDRALSLLVSLNGADILRPNVAWALAEAMARLNDLGHTERAHGLYRAAGAAVADALPPSGADTAAFRLTEAEVLQGIGDVAAAERALNDAIVAAAPLPAALLARALGLRAFLCAARQDLACARSALAAHPAAPLYANGTRTPASQGEAAYLSARAFVAALEGRADAVAAEALGRIDPRARGALSVHRQAGLALALPAGAEKLAALDGLGRALSAAAPSGATPGAWYRPGAVEQVLIGMALSRANPDDPGTAFALFQLAGRTGPSFDADALTALGQARSELQRRAVHQALRLRSRRDRLERTLARAVMDRPAGRDTGFAHDAGLRLRFRDFARRIAEAERSVSTGGVALSGANLTSLVSFQSVLAPNEAALSVTPTLGGLAYLCVRRDRTQQSTAVADLVRMRLDSRLVQAALTATHGPSDATDTQFPAEAAVRLHEALIRPFEGCLKPGDRIVWLSGVGEVAVPLSALLSAPPPRAGRGYDLAAADWLVKRHAVSYAGSASAVVSARAGVQASEGMFDFLGVGDPVLAGERGDPRFRDLAPLPDTREELVVSAQGFRQPRLLLGAGATERSLRSEMVGAYRYLSFATHGLVREEIEGLREPALVLTPVSADDPVDDGLLTASEIADLNLHARFVALSACNTANFDLNQMAQDLPALASAFAVAGVPATLATLWPVNSETGREVVSGTFGALRRRPGQGPADALAVAQRAFLAAPPGRAYLHPRFWAPFVVLGDGGVMNDPKPSLAPLVTSVEVLTHGGGEVLDVRRIGGGEAARFIGERDAAGVHAASVNVTGARPWRAHTHAVGASRFTTVLNDSLVVSGYQRVDGRYVPTLESFDAAGTPARAWRGMELGRRDIFLLGGTALDGDHFAVAVAELRAPATEPGPAVRVLTTGSDLSPRMLFETRAPATADLDDATLARFGGDLLLTYTDRSARSPRLDTGEPLGLDDFDTAACHTEAVTWIELRDAVSGALKASREIRGLGVAASLATRDGRLLLAGAATAACGMEARATVIAIDPRLTTRTLWTDSSVGASDVRTVAELPGGRLLLAASKTAVVDYRPLPDPRAPDPYRMGDVGQSYAGRVLTLARDGRAGPVRMLDSGSNVYVTALEAGHSDDVLLGGSLGGQAAIFRLTIGAPPGRSPSH